MQLAGPTVQDLEVVISNSRSLLKAICLRKA